MHSTFTRRHFLAGSAAAAAATLLTRRAGADPLGLPVGIQLYAVRDPMSVDPQDTLKKLYALGYREVEAAGYGKFTAKDYAKFIKDAGLKCPSAHLGFVHGKDEAPLFAEAHELGAHYATSSSMFPPNPHAVSDGSPDAPLKFGSAVGPDGFKYLADWMNDLGRKAKAAGLQYAYHNHSHEFEKLPSGLLGYDYLLTNTDKELVKFEIDCGWMSVAGQSPADYMTRYPGRFRMLHIKDFLKPAAPYTTAGSANRPKGTELGRGFVQYQPIFDAAKKSGVVHIFAEQENPFAVTPMDSAKVDYDFLHSFK
jgi:sugar phosphate isomerase/epimerase